MASTQCNKPQEETLSLSQKACAEKYYSTHGVAKTEVRCIETESKFIGQAHGHNHPSQAHGRIGHRGRGDRKKRGLFHKIKDGLTGHSSDSNSSSSSESDSDGKNKHSD